MSKTYLSLTYKTRLLLILLLATAKIGWAQVIISQYYEGSGTNKWIELTNMGSSSINTASPQLKLGLWAVSGSTGNIVFNGAATQTVNLNVVIPANGSVLIGHPTNGTNVPYLTAASAQQTSSSVINFNGNDGIALLDASNNVIDRFGTGINAVDISYVRNSSVTSPSTTFQLAQWNSTPLTTVHTANNTQSDYLGFHVSNPCATPTAQPTNLLFSNVGNVSATATFQATAAADEYLVLQSTSPSLLDIPVNGTVYNVNNLIGNSKVIQRSNLTTFTATNLVANTSYYFRIFSIKSTSCFGGPIYRISTPLSGSILTSINCPAPSSNGSNMTFTNITSNSLQLKFNASSTAESYLIVKGSTPSLTAYPVDGVTYNVGDALGNQTVAYFGTDTTFLDWGLDGNSFYFYSVFAAKTTTCVNGIRYRNYKPLQGYANTLNTTYQPYYGTLHSHSELSDGAGTVSGNLAFANAALCMDYLGISDHNHTSAGMTLSNWNQGVAMAKTASTSTFCALYGMEWGVISGGGHVLVYGTDSLMGWDPGQYQIYVPQNTYVGAGGLFEKVTTVNANTFAMLAHPNSGDFNDVATVYDATADLALTGCAVENGPSTSVDTTYSDNPTSMAYLTFYRNMLARGYHVGPTIDHDNHNITHGHTALTRTAVWSKSIAKRHILEAFKERRFYATQDCAAIVDFKIGGFPMGSIMQQASVPTITVTANTTSPVTSLKLYSGVPGSGSNANILTSNTSNNLTYTHAALTDLSTRYYYVDITEADGTRIITAPIWYNRNDGIVPVIDDEDNRPIGELSAEEGGINVYPNPVKDWLHIYRTATSAQERLWIMNTTGQVVYQDKMKVDESAKDISVKGWAKGIYIIRIGNWIERVVVD